MPRKGNDDQFYFEGFDNPNTTPVPDVVFDVLLSRLKEAELKALLYIIRRTFGFKKDRDPISFNQFLRGIATRDGRQLDAGCGIKDRTTLSRALRSLEDMGIVISQKGMDARGENATTVYRLRFKGGDSLPAQLPPAGSPSPAGVVGNSYHRGMENPPPVVGDSYLQETVLQETVLQETEEQDIYPSNIRKVKTDQITSQADEPSITDIGPETQADASPPPTSLPSHTSQNPRKQGFVSAGDVLAGKLPNGASTGPTTRQKPYSDDRQIILGYIRDFAIELGDEAPLPSSVSRAYNLYEQSGVPMARFIAYLFEARSLTQEYSANVKKTRGGDSNPFGPRKNKMAYFFGILESRLANTPPKHGNA